MSNSPRTLTFAELVQSILDGTKQATIADHLIALALAAQADPKYRDALEITPDTRELGDLVAKALGDGSSTAGRAVVAYYELLRADDADDRNKAVQHSKHLLTLITRETYPHIWATTHLRIGTALLFMEAVPSKENVLSAIENLKESLLVFTAEKTPNEYCLAHYNLAFLYDSPTMVADEWENPDYTESILEHGLAAIGLLNSGVQGGNRASLAKMLLRLVLSQPMAARTFAPTAINIAETTLKARNATPLSRIDRKELTKYLELIREYVTADRRNP